MFWLLFLKSLIQCIVIIRFESVPHFEYDRLLSRTVSFVEEDYFQNAVYSHVFLSSLLVICQQSCVHDMTLSCVMCAMYSTTWW